MFFYRTPFAVSAESAVLAQGWSMHETLDHRVREASIAEITIPRQHIVIAGQIDSIRCVNYILLLKFGVGVCVANMMAIH